MKASDDVVGNIAKIGFWSMSCFGESKPDDFGECEV